MPSNRSYGIAQKAAAVAALAAAALLFYYLTHVPLAIDVANLEGKAEVVDEIVLSPLGAGRLPFISIEGIDNEGLDVRFDEARLDDASAQGLRSDFKLDLPLVQGAITWKTATKGSGHTMVDISVEPTKPAPEVHITHIGEGAHPGLRLTARNATLTAQLAVLFGDSDQGAAPEQKTLQIAHGPALRVPGAIPLTIIVPEGSAFTISFPVEKPGSSFHLGAAEDPHAKSAGLALRYLGIRKPGSEDYRLFACAANAGARLWAWRGLRPQDCAPAPTLLATIFKLASDHTSVTLAGSAFVSRQGQVETDPWFTKLESNKPLAAFLGVVISALAAWVWKAFYRADPDAKKASARPPVDSP